MKCPYCNTVMFFGNNGSVCPTHGPMRGEPVKGHDLLRLGIGLQPSYDLLLMPTAPKNLPPKKLKP